ncbi:MAG: iron-containing redox enzyme family protein [Polyangiaceae bacterium]
MLGALAESLPLKQSGDTVWEALALSNLMVALATARHYAYQSVGALGVIELTAPGRSQLVNEGLKRLGIAGAARRYYALHATLDVRRSASWNREVLQPLVASNPAIAPRIAEGALLRLRAGKRCFERYRRELWDEHD